VRLTTKLGDQLTKQNNKLWADRNER